MTDLSLETSFYFLVTGVIIIPVLQRTLHYECIILVKQFRPPMGSYCLEFPAGESLHTGHRTASWGLSDSARAEPEHCRV